MSNSMGNDDSGGGDEIEWEGSDEELRREKGRKSQEEMKQIMKKKRKVQEGMRKMFGRASAIKRQNVREPTLSDFVGSTISLRPKPIVGKRPTPKMCLSKYIYQRVFSQLTFIRRAVGDNTLREMMEIRAFIRCNNDLEGDFTVVGS